MKSKKMTKKAKLNLWNDYIHTIKEIGDIFINSVETGDDNPEVILLSSFVAFHEENFECCIKKINVTCSCGKTKKRNPR